MGLTCTFTGTIVGANGTVLAGVPVEFFLCGPGGTHYTASHNLVERGLITATSNGSGVISQVVARNDELTPALTYWRVECKAAGLKKFIYSNGDTIDVIAATDLGESSQIFVGLGDTPDAIWLAHDHVQSLTAAQKLQGTTNLGLNLTASKLLGQASSGGTGLPVSITLGTNLSISGTTLNAVDSATGTVTSVEQSFTGGLITVGGSPITGAGTLALTVAGTSGGIPYFNTATSWTTSGLLAAGGIMVGGGAGATPSTVAAGAATTILVGGGAGLAPVWTIATGTGAPVRENAPTLIAPILGAATATSLNAATGTLTLGAQTINLAAGVGGAGGSINLAAGAGAGANSAGGSINLSGGDGAENPGGSINTSGSDNGDHNPGGSISTNGDEGGSGGSINTSAGASDNGGSINTSDGGGSITTTAGGSITTGVGSLTFTGAGATTFALGASAQTYTFPTTTATLARTDATAQTFSAAQTINTAGGKLTIQDTGNATSADHLTIATLQTTLSLGMDGSANAKISSTRTLAINCGATYGVNITASFLTMTGTTTLTGNLTSNGALISTPQALSGTTLGAINITTLTTTLAATGVATATLTATGVANGQIKVIVMTQATGACTVTVTNASWGGMGTAVFDAVGDTLMLQYLNSKWTPISNIGVVLA